MAGAFVHGLQEAVQAFTEGVVAFRAAHAADFLELGGGESAGRAGCLGAQGGRALAEKRLREAKAHFIGDALRLGAGVAKIHRRHLPIDDLGQKHGGFTFADVTFHRGGIPGGCAIAYDTHGACQRYC